MGANVDETHAAYFKWDDPRSAARLRRLGLPAGERYLVLDEIHKYARWRNISLVEQLVDLLPERVGSPLSIKSLREDLAVDHKTVERWLTILENLYLCSGIRRQTTRPSRPTASAGAQVSAADGSQDSPRQLDERAE